MLDIMVYKNVIKRQNDVLDNFIGKATKDLQLALRRENLKIGGLYKSINGDTVKIVHAVVDQFGELYIIYKFIDSLEGDISIYLPCETFKYLYKQIG